MARAPRNRTITLLDEERQRYRKELLRLEEPAGLEDVLDRVINQDLFDAIDHLPSRCVDLLFVDPPYNLTKAFSGRVFKKTTREEYREWVESWLVGLKGLLKSTASIYICGDWRSSAALQEVCGRHFTIRNRITFEREKGRGAQANWKNSSEDIWFCTVSNDYCFDPEAVKLKRRVIAPYRDNGEPKGWEEEAEGDFRLTHASNLWTDITIPFWSMSENTPHPTQKPEKLLAKILLASSREGDVILDPFAGVGTAGVVAKKLNRHFVMVEIDEDYCLYAVKRLHAAAGDAPIQGYLDGVFWERNTLADMNKSRNRPSP